MSSYVFKCHLCGAEWVGLDPVVFKRIGCPCPENGFEVVE